jgi:hypothetical protein
MRDAQQSGEREEREEDDAAVWRRAEERDGAISDMLTNIQNKILRSQCPSTFTAQSQWSEHF